MNVDTYGELRQIQSDIAMVALSLSAKSEREDDKELETHYRKLLELHKRLGEALCVLRDEEEARDLDNPSPIKES